MTSESQGHCNRIAQKLFQITEVRLEEFPWKPEGRKCRTNMPQWADRVPKKDPETRNETCFWRSCFEGRCPTRLLSRIYRKNHTCFGATPNMTKCVSTAPARADRGSDPPENKNKRETTTCQPTRSKMPIRFGKIKQELKGTFFEGFLGGGRHILLCLFSALCFYFLA